MCAILIMDACILVHGRIKEATRVIPQHTWWITSYPPIINGSKMLNTKTFSLYIAAKTISGIV